MKKLLFPMLATAMLSFLVSANAQSVPEPDYKNKVHVLDGNSLSDLDNTPLNGVYKPSLSGKATVNIEAKGKTSSVTLDGTTSNKFIVKIAADIDPEGYIELFKFDIHKKKIRKILVAQMVMGKNKDIDLPRQGLKIEKVKDGVFIITTKSNLEKGEYVFIVDRPEISYMNASSGVSLKGFCFSVK